MEKKEKVVLIDVACEKKELDVLCAFLNICGECMIRHVLRDYSGSDRQLEQDTEIIKKWLSRAEKISSP